MQNTRSHAPQGMMKPRLFGLESLLIFVLLALLTAAVLAQANPFLTIPNPDGGFNLFAGSEILKGRLPYVDFWDTKGPAIYYLNALGLYLGHGLRWGMFGFEFVSVLTSFVLLFSRMRRQWGVGAAAFGVIVAMVGLNSVLNSGNLTEEYSLLFNSIALYAFWPDAAPGAAEDQGEERPRAWSRWRYLIIGCMAGITFSFRANNVGVPAAIVLSMVIADASRRRYKAAAGKILLIGAGFIVPVLIGILYFWFKGALPDYLGAVYFYSLRYAGARGHSLDTFLAGFKTGKLGWPAWVALAGGIWALGAMLRKLAIRAAISGLDVLFATVLWIEVLLSGLSARMFTHYFIPWTLAIGLLSAYLFAHAISLLRPAGIAAFLQGKWPRALLAGLVLGVALVAYPDLNPYGSTVSQILLHRAEGIEFRDYMSSYVDRHTQRADFVLTWPVNPWINFAAKRESPVRLLFYPMFDAGTITVEQGRGYVEDLAAHKPALIIDCTDLQNDVPSLDAQTRQLQYATRDSLFDPPYIQQVFDYVAGHYHVEWKTSKCTIYRRNP